jgi:protein-arginine kinase activator protein McsA
MNFLTIILLILFGFLVGYNYRRYEEEKNNRKMWRNFTKNLYMIQNTVRDSGNFHKIKTNGGDHKTDLSILQITELERELELALSNEDYLRAAKIRDLLKNLK